jgi:prophage regulatory protein
MAPQQTFLKIIRRPDVLSKTGFSKSTLYNRIKDGVFPSPISLGSRAVGFVQSECDEVINSMIAGQSPEQIKLLVSGLVRQRKQLVRGQHG